MSFVDIKLLEQLLKQGQTSASSPEDIAALKNQVKSLQDQLGDVKGAKDPNAMPEISHDGTIFSAPQLKSDNLEDLRELVAWLTNNALTVDGQRISYAAKQDPKNQAWQFYQVEANGQLTPAPDHTPEAEGYFIDPTLLNKYLVSLQAYNSQHPNQFLQIQLTKIIQQANQQLGANVEEQYKVPEKALSDNVILDTVPKDFVDVRTSLIGGDVPLTYGDVKNDQAFNKWLSDHNVSIQEGDQKLLINNPSFNKGAILSILAARASYQISRATDAEAKEKAQIYNRQTQAIAIQNHITLNQTSQSTNKQTTDQKSTPNQEQANQPANAASLIKEIVDTLPLALQNIDFNRIREFFGKMAQLMSNNPTVMNYISNTEQLMQKATALTQNQDTVFQLGIAPESLARMFADQKTPGKVFYPFVQLLDTIVDNVRAVVGYFVSQYNNQISDQQRAFVYGQIGKRPDDTSIYSRNVEYLNNWAKTSHT
jgi:hypothetical protein